MFKTTQLLILPIVLSTFIYAVDLNRTDEILNSAMEAVQTMQVEINEAIIEPQEVISSSHQPLEGIVAEMTTDFIVEESNNTTLMLPISIEESNVEALTSEETIIIEDNNISSDENNLTAIPEPMSEEKGNVTTGKNIFKYVLKADCNMNGHKFANKYSQEEWEEIAELNKFKETIFEECPNSTLYYQDRWTVDLYKFFHEMSNDEEGIPEC